MHRYYPLAHMHVHYTSCRPGLLASAISCAPDSPANPKTLKLCCFEHSCVHSTAGIYLRAFTCGHTPAQHAMDSRQAPGQTRDTGMRPA